MRPDKQNLPEKNNLRRSSRFELFFWEQVGSRYYLRFTRLAFYLIVGIAVVPAALLVTLFIWNQRADSPNTNVNIIGAPNTNVKIVGPSPTMPKQTPVQPPLSPLPSPRVVRQPRADVPTMPTPQRFNDTSNELLVPEQMPQTPQPSPTKPPG